MSGSNDDNETLESILNKATSPLNDQDDWDCIVKFCEKVNTEYDGIQTCTRLLVHKMQSPQEREAMQALTVLEACVKNCGENFHKEMGKYRFLNELIKLVSPKYLGAQTSKKIQDKVIGMLYTWSIALSDQVKIRDAYQMLKKQGIVKVDPAFNQSLISNPPPPREDDTLFTDKEKKVQLDRLLKSNKPEDLQAANRLIKSVVKEDEERMEKLKKRNATLEEVNNNVKLLNEMLAQFNAENPALPEMQTMKELYDGCIKLRPTLFRLASDTNDDEEALMNILRANDEVTKTIQAYESNVQPKMQMKRNDNADGAPEPVKTETKQEVSSALFELSGLNLSATGKKQVNGDSFDVFNVNSKPFGDDVDVNLLNFKSAPVESSSDDINSLLSGLTMPQSAAKIPDVSSPQSSKISTTPTSKTPSAFADIDMLSKSLLEQSLGGKTGTSFPATSHKLSLNEMSHKPKNEEKAFPLISNEKVRPNAFDVDFFATKTSASTEVDDFSSPKPLSHPFSQPLIPPATQPTTSTPLVVDTLNTKDFSINNLFVELEAIKPSNHPPITAYDNNGIRVMLHFSKDHAAPDRTDTLVSVVSIMSTRTNPVQNIVFQAAAPKVMKVKLQPPSSTELPAYNPIFSTPPLTQIMIIANPSKKEVKIRFKLDYKIDQQTSISENGLISGFPAFEQWGKL